MSRIVSGSRAITPPWLTDVLREAGASTAGPVSEVVLEPVGGGLMSRSVRARLSYEPPAAGPASVLVKFPTDDAGSLALASAMNMYALEVRFYSELAPKTNAPLAKCYLAELSDDAQTFTLVLEDLSAHSRPGDVLTPCSPDEVSAALDALVGLQAPLWNSPWLRELGWLTAPEATAAMFDQMSQGSEPFLARFGSGLDPEHVKLFEAIMPHAGDWVRAWRPPLVLQHGDFRPDNLMFGARESAAPVTVIDFHTLRLGPPGVDVAYLLGGSLPTDVRRSVELDLLDEYHGRLVSQGVMDFDSDSCWRAYQEGSLYGVFLFVGVAARVESTERGDKVIVDQIRRYADMAIDLEAASVLA
jgi:hypothetical protein